MLGGYAAHGQKTLLEQFAQGPQILGVAEMKTLTSMRLIRFTLARSYWGAKAVLRFADCLQKPFLFLSTLSDSRGEDLTRNQFIDSQLCVNHPPS